MELKIGPSFQYRLEYENVCDYNIMNTTKIRLHRHQWDFILIDIGKNQQIIVLSNAFVLFQVTPTYLFYINYILID